MNKVLIIDDDPSALRLIEVYLKKWGYRVSEMSNGNEATPDAVGAIDPDVILLDMMLPGKSGEEILGELRPVFPDTPIIMITSFGSIETAVRTMKVGAYDFMTKPIDPTRLEIMVGNAAKASRMARKLSEFDASHAARSRHGDIIGCSDAMQKIYEMIDALAESEASALITGETGTGKEMVACAIHDRSARAGKMFVPVNCGALPEGIIESELFGHVRGAFTGAVKDKKGRFELANGGTIFLDEVGDLPPATQVKLLRVLQEGTYERVGGEQTMKCDARVISATNRDLKAMMAQGKFREDLYYRICVAPVEMPPLRERRTDIPQLAEHFLILLTCNKESRAGISKAAMDALLDYNWPGNVRQFRNALEFALLKRRDESAIEPRHLPPEILRERGDPEKLKPGRKPVLNEISVRDALRRAGGNKAKAARILHVGRATLYRFLRDNNID
jgi:DNA-binding NtrC family response regulator